MNKSIKLKVAAFGLAIGMGVANTAALASASCARACHYEAIQKTTSFCGSIGAGSACGSVHSGVYRNYYNQCMQTC